VSRPPSSSPGWYARAGKRAVDIGCAGVGLLLLSPLLLVIALLILVTDPGPVIFVQERVGRQGRTFRFFKFRSMPVGTRNIAKDQLGQVRLTWFGRLLRRSNLDELPQLFNILRGDMSVVGPRPSLPSQQELIVLRQDNGALACRPGLTGWAQVNAYDGMPIADKARRDGEYASSISLRQDIRIILLTFGYLTKPPPVY
jgi:O-antigen biosynthesis protein WbqP